MAATSVDDERAYVDDRFSAPEVYTIERSRAVCGYFEPGQFIPVHAPDSEVTVVVRDGDRSHEVGPGSVVTVPAGENRGGTAGEERLEAVLVTAPPTDAEHEPVREVLENDQFEP
ncbi:MAG: cupin domain-containing protein [Halolamina sp.]